MEELPILWHCHEKLTQHLHQPFLQHSLQRMTSYGDPQSSLLIIALLPPFCSPPFLLCVHACTNDKVTRNSLTKHTACCMPFISHLHFMYFHSCAVFLLVGGTTNKHPYCLHELHYYALNTPNAVLDCTCNIHIVWIGCMCLLS
jgi:hypothetical protein